MFTNGRGEKSSSIFQMVVGDERSRCNQEGVSIIAKGEGNEFYRQLWLKCAGPLVTLPRVGDKVFYFPQGHVEQVEACTKKDIDVEMPIYNLPDRILCKVVYVRLQAEPITDEVFAQITLLPEREGSITEEGSSLSLPVKSDAPSFTKKLTPSDTSTHGGCSIPKRAAEECFPHLDMSQDSPAQELVAKDLHGLEWHFRHVYRGHPKRHLFTTGWSTFVSAKKLVPGDSCTFLRGNGDLYVGVQRAKVQQNKASASVLSSQSMQHGILASAFHAVLTGTMFNVYYRPWTSPAEFIIPYNCHMKAAEIEYEVGKRFKMQFERKGEEVRTSQCLRFSGTITGADDIDHIRWPGSEWRCLKVKWEIDSKSLVLPERVSPWSIELIEISKRKKKPTESYSKRLCPFDPSIPFIIKNDFLKSLDELRSPRHIGVLQGQEIKKEDVIAGESAQQCKLNLTLQPNAEREQVPVGLANKKDLQDHDLNKNPGTNKLPSDGKASSLMFVNARSSTISSDEDHDTFGACSMLPVQNVNPLNYEYQEKGQTEPLESQPDGTSKFMLFGINIFHSHSELPLPQIIDGGGHSGNPNTSPPVVSHLSNTESINAQECSKRISSNLLEGQCGNCCFLAGRSCTKVLKSGTALGRSVNLSRVNGYEELIRQLDEMFDFNGTLINGSCGWQVSYTDSEGDVMLLADYAWPEFLTTVRKLFIRPKNAADFWNADAP